MFEQRLRSCLLSPNSPQLPVSQTVAQLKELMGRMNPTSYGPKEAHLWLMGNISTKTWENCRETSERKSRTHFYQYLVDLLIELAMEREIDSHMDKYLRKHLRRETPAEKALGWRSPQPHAKGTPRVKGSLIFSTIVLRTIRVDPATPAVMGEVFACSN